MPAKKKNNRDDDDDAEKRAGGRKSPPLPVATVVVSDEVAQGNKPEGKASSKTKKPPVTAAERRRVVEELEEAIDAAPLQSGVPRAPSKQQCTWGDLRKTFAKTWDVVICDPQTCKDKGMIDPSTGKHSHMVCNKCSYVTHAQNRQTSIIHMSEDKRITST